MWEANSKQANNFIIFRFPVDASTIVELWDEEEVYVYVFYFLFLWYEIKFFLLFMSEVILLLELSAVIINFEENFHSSRRGKRMEKNKTSNLKCVRFWGAKKLFRGFSYISSVTQLLKRAIGVSSEWRSMEFFVVK